MEWKIDFLDRDGVVHVESSGPMTQDDIRQMSGEIIAAGRSKGVHSFLVDLRYVEPRISTLEIDALPGMLKQMGVTAEDRVAILYDPSSPQSHRFSFFQNVSLISALQFRNFTDAGKATEWLVSVPDSPESIPAVSVRGARTKS